MRIGKTAGYKNKILISNIGMKVGWNKKTKKAEVYHLKSRSHVNSPKAYAANEMHSVKSSDDETIKDYHASHHEPVVAVLPKDR